MAGKSPVIPAYSKYRAKPATFGGIWFRSQAECARYQVLLIERSAGRIANLELQPRLPLNVNGMLVCTYVADFRYMRKHDDGSISSVVEDVKGIETPEFRLKKRLVKAVLGIDIFITRR